MYTNIYLKTSIAFQPFLYDLKYVKKQLRQIISVRIGKQIPSNNGLTLEMYCLPQPPKAIQHASNLAPCHKLLLPIVSVIQFGVSRWEEK